MNCHEIYQKWLAEPMNRHFRRRVEREWNKIKLGNVCTKFVQRNGLFSIPYVVFFQAVKVGEYFMCVYNVRMFEYKEGSGYLERVIICQFINNLFRSLCSIELGYVSEEDLEKGEEVQSIPPYGFERWAENCVPV